MWIKAELSEWYPCFIHFFGRHGTFKEAFSSNHKWNTDPSFQPWRQFTNFHDGCDKFHYCGKRISSTNAFLPRNEEIRKIVSNRENDSERNGLFIAFWTYGKDGSNNRVSCTTVRRFSQVTAHCYVIFLYTVLIFVLNGGCWSCFFTTRLQVDWCEWRAAILHHSLELVRLPKDVVGSRNSFREVECS